MKKLLVQIIAGILGLWLSAQFVPGVEFDGTLKSLAITGLILGLLNYFIKPLLKGITLPLRILTLNLFTIVISMALLWLVDLITPELTIVHGLNLRDFIPLFWTTVIIWLISYFLSLITKKVEKTKKSEKEKSEK